jgi:hypothetical protein
MKPNDAFADGQPQAAAFTLGTVSRGDPKEALKYSLQILRGHPRPLITQ